MIVYTNCVLYIIMYNDCIMIVYINCVLYIIYIVYHSHRLHIVVWFHMHNVIMYMTYMCIYMPLICRLILYDTLYDILARPLITQKSREYVVQWYTMKTTIIYVYHFCLFNNRYVTKGFVFGVITIYNLWPHFLLTPDLQSSSDRAVTAAGFTCKAQAQKPVTTHCSCLLRPLITLNFGQMFHYHMIWWYHSIISLLDGAYY